MATLSEFLEQQFKMINEAKKTLEEAQKKPPPTSGPNTMREATIVELKARVTNLTTTKDDIVRQMDEQIRAYQKEIAALEQQIEEDKKQPGNQPPPRLRGRGAKS